MQFDQFDKKVKEAADHHHPAYDEQAWAKMEKMLNKYLPQKEDDRRRFIFFLLLFLGLGGAGLIVAKSWKGRKSLAVTEQSVQQKQPAVSNVISGQDKKVPEINKTTEKNSSQAVTSVVINNKPGDNPSDIKQAENWEISSSKKKSGVTNTSDISSPDSKAKKNKPAVNVDRNKEQSVDITLIESSKKTKELQESKTSDPVTNVPVIEKRVDEPAIANSVLALNADKTAINENPKIADEKKENSAIAQNKEKAKKKKTKKSNSFFFTLSTGPDVSFAGNDKLGKMKLLAGAGFSYIFNNRVTIRTGFYSGRKIYTASPKAYHAPASFYIYYPYLEKIDADCKVYEIPLSISYNFGQKEKQNWFVSVGLSSYLMKKETYNYFYKYTATGPTISRKWTIDNENKHYFSTLTLSGGYQRNISKTLSVMLEPYIKLPLSGVGYGKVKLNSGGVLFSIGIKPFAAKKDKPLIGH